MHLPRSIAALIVTAVLPAIPARADNAEAQLQHAGIGVTESKASHSHTDHPDAQWFPDAGLGLFLHWDEGSVHKLETSWPMIAGSFGRLWKGKVFDQAEIARIIRERDWDLNGKKGVTGDEYWGLAKEFNPTDFHPEVWLKKAKEAGFVYAVMTTKHHNGFAMWPSAYGGFNTKDTPMKGRDLVKEYVEACRAAGLKVGLYFSGPDWHFDRDYFNFLYHGVADTHKGTLPEIGPDHEPRTTTHTPEEIKAHQDAYAAMVRGQIEELLTRYGKIDLIWFDGCPPLPDVNSIMPIERIRQLQPGIVINPRFHGHGDFITPEGKLPDDLRLKTDEWGELCSCWTGNWSYTGRPCRALNNVISELVRSRASGINNLLDLGPTATGDLAPDEYENLAKLGEWMKVNGESIHGTRALQGAEKASVPATAKGGSRYLYLIPPAKGSNDVSSVSFTGLHGNYQARILGSEEALAITTAGDTINIALPKQTSAEPSVQVVKLSPR